jgi:lipoyl-dependent peroxiredoxin
MTASQTLYTTHAHATAGRSGHGATADGRLDVHLTHPVAQPRPATGTDPEQLFAVAYAACFGGAVEFVAKQDGIALDAPVRVDSTVSLQTRPAGGFQITAALVVRLLGLTQAQADALVAKAHEVCPYSNATRGNVDVQLKAVVG